MSSTLRLMRLMQLASPALPIGGYSYSQGLEWVVHQGWVHDQSSYKNWLAELIHGNLCHQELPLLACLHTALVQDQIAYFDYLTELAIACRDTHELRQEERARGRAMVKVLNALGDFELVHLREALERTQLASYALAACHWEVGQRQLLATYSFAWLESQVAAATKLVPLGQNAAQKILYDFPPMLEQKIDDVIKLRTCSRLDDTEFVFSTPAVSFASSAHESQYSRLFRS